MRIDVKDLPVFDNHCHPYWLGKESRPMYKFWNSSLFHIEDRHLAASTTYMMVNNMLRRYMDLPESMTRDEVLAERNRRYEEDPVSWIHGLVKQANIKGMLIDISYPINAWLTGVYMTDEQLQWFEDTLSPLVDLHHVLRFEVIYNKILGDELGFDAFIDRFHANVDAEVKLYKPVAFKSVIAYFTGLEVEPVPKEAAAAAYDKYQKDRGDYQSERTLRNHMLYHHGMQLCLKYNLPLQIHTGMGNTPMCKLDRMKPTLLHELFCAEEHQKIKTILLHAGYPFMREASYMTAHFPQVSLDVSQMIPHAGRAGETGLYNLMEVAPYTKIHYASDGGALPEHTWYTANYFKDILSEVLTNFTDRGIFTRTEAYEIATRILTENTKEFYGI